MRPIDGWIVIDEGQPVYTFGARIPFHIHATDAGHRLASLRRGVAVSAGARIARAHLSISPGAAADEHA